MKPGPAISTRSKTVPVRSRAAQMASAILRGAHLNGRAHAMAMLEAKSPCDVSAGISTTKSGSSDAAGRAPDSTARSSAPSSRTAISCFAWETGLVMYYTSCSGNFCFLQKCAWNLHYSRRMPDGRGGPGQGKFLQSGCRPARKFTTGGQKTRLGGIQRL